MAAGQVGEEYPDHNPNPKPDVNPKPEVRHPEDPEDPEGPIPTTPNPNNSSGKPDDPRPIPPHGARNGILWELRYLTLYLVGHVR